MEENSSFSIGDTDRFVGETVTEVNQTDNDLLLHQPFTKSEDQFIVGEVSPREQDGGIAPGGAEMVVDNLSDPPSEESSRGSHQITEEKLPAQSQLVPSSGFNGNDGLQVVSKDWVLSQIDKVQESNSLKILTLEEKMTQMEVKFDQQIKEKNEELQSKQRELDECQAELELYKQEVQDLQEKLTHETEVRAEVERENSVLEEKLEKCTVQIKQRERDIGNLEREIKYLSENLETAKKANRTDDTLERMTDLLREIHVSQQQVTPAHPDTHHTPDTPSPSQSRNFRFAEGQHPHTEVEPLKFSPDSSVCGPPSDQESDD